MRKRITELIPILKTFFMFLLAFIVVFCAAYHFVQTHFLWNIQIDGISCEFLTIEEAIKKINEEKTKETVLLSFHDGKKYTVALNEFGVFVDENRIKEIFELQYFNFKDNRQYDLSGDILTDYSKVDNYLKSIPELQEQNMTTPLNAYIIWDETKFTIVPERLGDVINFEEALTLTLKKIQDGVKCIDFSDITYTTPDLLTDDLQSELEALNSILYSSIDFELTDGSIVSLNSDVIKTWVYKAENDKYAFDFENGIPLFVNELAIKVDEANKNMQFLASESEKMVTVNVPSDVRPQLDKEAQIENINTLIGNPNPLHLTPIYDRQLISDMFGNHIELDIARQHIWFYKNGELIVSTPCVTGNVRDGNDTPTGVFFLKNKNRDVYLEGFNNDGTPYKSFVKYWMRIYRGIGLHDASWRYKFGGDIYLTGGSHGCINMPESAAAKTFENIDNTIPVIVYNSNI